MLRSLFEREEQSMRAAVAALATDEETDASSIEAQLAPLLGTARGHFLFLERGGVGLLHARLKEAGARFSGLLPWCRLLALCCRDEESAVALGLLGGHRWLLDMEGAHDEEEEEAAEAVVECAAEIAGRCSVVRGGFPLRTLALCETTVKEALQLPARITFDSSSSTASSNDDGLVVLLTPIADRRMAGQADTGYLNWPAATILARWVALHSDIVAGKTVMEIGAGLGLVGLVAGRWARRVLLTDYNSACLERLQRHVELNRDDAEAAPAAVAAGPALAREDGVSVRWLDWDRIESLLPPSASGAVSGEEGGERWRVVAAAVEGEEEEEEQGEQQHSFCFARPSSAFGRPAWGAPLLDVIVGSDVICDASCARGVARLLAAALKPAAEGGVAYVTAPFPAHRYGVDSFPAELKAHGLGLAQEEVTDPRLLEGIPEAAYMRFHLFSITKPQGVAEDAAHCPH